MARVKEEVREAVAKSIDNLPPEMLNKCGLCNRTLYDQLVSIATQVHAPQKTVCDLFAERYNSIRAEHDHISGQAFLERIKTIDRTNRRELTRQEGRYGGREKAEPLRPTLPIVGTDIDLSGDSHRISQEPTSGLFGDSHQITEQPQRREQEAPKLPPGTTQEQYDDYMRRQAESSEKYRQWSEDYTDGEPFTDHRLVVKKNLNSGGHLSKWEQYNGPQPPIDAKLHPRFIPTAEDGHRAEEFDNIRVVRLLYIKYQSNPAELLKVMMATFDMVDSNYAAAIRADSMKYMARLNAVDASAGVIAGIDGEAGEQSAEIQSVKIIAGKPDAEVSEETSRGISIAISEPEVTEVGEGIGVEDSLDEGDADETNTISLDYPADDGNSEPSEEADSPAEGSYENLNSPRSQYWRGSSTVQNGRET